MLEGYKTYLLVLIGLVYLGYLSSQDLIASEFATTFALQLLGLAGLRRGIESIK